MEYEIQTIDTILNGWNQVTHASAPYTTLIQSTDYRLQRRNVIVIRDYRGWASTTGYVFQISRKTLSKATNKENNAQIILKRLNVRQKM